MALPKWPCPGRRADCLKAPKTKNRGGPPYTSEFGMSIRRRAGTLAVVMSALFSLSSGCSSNRNEVEQSSSALNGSLFFDEPTDSVCIARRAEFQAAFQAAWPYLIAEVKTDPTRLTACFKDALLSGFVDQRPGSGSTFVEDIVSRLGEDLPTHILCAPYSDGFVGCSSSDGQHLQCDPHVIDNYPHDYPLAGLVLHELSHHYWDHPSGDEYNASIPSVAYMCIATLHWVSTPVPADEYAYRRSLASSAETTLPQVGLELESLIEPTYCATNDYVSGFYGSSSGLAVDSLGAVCKTLGSSATTTLPIAGSFNGTYYRNTCTSSEVAVGAWGRGVHELDAIGAVCAQEADVRNGGGAPQRTPAAGGQVSGIWERQCPPFQALKGLRLRAGNQVDRVELVCQDVRLPEEMRQHPAAAASTTGDFSYREQCQDHAVLTALETGADTNIRRLGAYCRIVDTGAGTAVTLRDSDPKRYRIMASHGAWGTNPALDECPAGQGLIGLKVYFDGDVMAGISGHCASISDWSSGATSAAAVSDTPVRGRVTNSSDSPACLPSEFLVGWTLKEGPAPDGFGFIHGVTPICRSFGILPLCVYDSSTYGSCVLQ